MRFEELERKVEGQLPNLSHEGLVLVELFMPFCRGLHAENDRLRKENKELRDQLVQNSRSSSKPPSQDMNRPVKRRPEGIAKRPVGGQPGHKGRGGQLKGNPDHIVPYQLGDCPGCGHDLRQVEVEEVVRKQVEEIYRGYGKHAHVGMGVLPGFSRIAHRGAYRLAEFTNNQAECDLRMNRVRAEVSGGGWELEPAHEFMRIRSAVGIAIKQAVNPL